jgi:hypothetical protein
MLCLPVLYLFRASVSSFIKYSTVYHATEIADGKIADSCFFFTQYPSRVSGNIQKTTENNKLFPRL